MKWRIRKWADKCVVFLVGVRPIRWFFDQLINLEEWVKKRLFLHTIFRWYCKIRKPFWIALCTYFALYAAWKHDIWSVLCDIGYIIIWLIIPDDWHKPDDNGDDDSPDSPDPTPNGDVIDRWLREQQKVRA